MTNMPSSQNALTSQREYADRMREYGKGLKAFARTGILLAGSLLTPPFAADVSRYEPSAKTPGIAYAQALPSTPEITRVVNAADNTPNFAPNMPISAFGKDLAPCTQQLPEPSTMACDGFQAFLNGKELPLRYASPTQVNADIPVTSDFGPSTLEFRNQGTTVASYPVNITERFPVVFGVPLDEKTRAGGYGMAYRIETDARNNRKQTLIGLKEPARAGGEVLLYYTGSGRNEEWTDDEGVLHKKHPVPDVYLNGRGAEILAADAAADGISYVSFRVPDSDIEGIADMQICFNSALFCSDPLRLPVIAPGEAYIAGWAIDPSLAVDKQPTGLSIKIDGKTAATPGIYREFLVRAPKDTETLFRVDGGATHYHWEDKMTPREGVNLPVTVDPRNEPVPSGIIYLPSRKEARDILLSLKGGLSVGDNPDDYWINTGKPMSLLESLYWQGDSMLGGCNVSKTYRPVTPRKYAILNKNNLPETTIKAIREGLAEWNKRKVNFQEIEEGIPDVTIEVVSPQSSELHGYQGWYKTKTAKSCIAPLTASIFLSSSLREDKLKILSTHESGHALGNIRHEESDKMIMYRSGSANIHLIENARDEFSDLSPNGTLVRKLKN